MNFQIIKPLIRPSLALGIVMFIVMFVMMFIPEFLGEGLGVGECDDVSFVVFGNYELFRWSSMLAKMVQMAVLFAIGLFLMSISRNLQIIPIRSSMPFFMFVMIVSVVDYFHYFSNTTVAVVLFLLAFWQLLLLYYRASQYTSAFNIGVLVALSAIFNGEFVLLAPLFLFGFVIFGSFTFRVIAAFLLGILFLVFIVVSLFFVFAEEIYDFEMFSGMRFFDYEDIVEVLYSDVLFAILMIMAAMWSLVVYFTASSNHKLNVRLNFKFIMVSLLTSIVWVLMLLSTGFSIVLIPIMFIVLLLSLYFSTSQSKVANGLFLTLIVLCVAYRVFWIIGM